MTPGERKSGKNNDSWFDVEVKRFGEDEPYIDPDPGIPEIPGKEQRVRELEAIKKRVSAKGWFPAGRMNPQAPKPRMGPHHANMNEGDGEEGKFVAMPRGLYTQPMKRGSYNAPGILIGQSIRNAPPSSPVVVRQRVVKTAHVKVRVNTKEKKEGAEGEGAEGAEGEGAEGESAETETPKPKEEPKKQKQKPPSPDRPWRTPHKVKPLSPPKDYNEAMRDKLAALSTANKLRKEEEAKTAPSLPPDEYQPSKMLNRKIIADARAALELSGPFVAIGGCKSETLPNGIFDEAGESYEYAPGDWFEEPLPPQKPDPLAPKPKAFKPPGIKPRPDKQTYVPNPGGKRGPEAGKARRAEVAAARVANAPRGAWKPGSGGAPKSLPVKTFGKFDPGPFPAPTSLRNTQYVQ